MRYLALLLLCGCAPTIVQRMGIPASAAATTFCDEAGKVRSALDADLFRIDSLGNVGAVSDVPAILVHEAVHRLQLESRRPAVGECPPLPTIAQLLHDEVEAYCVGYAMAVMRGAHPEDVGGRYARALVARFTPWLGEHTRKLVDARWRLLCPGRQLVWDTP